MLVLYRFFKVLKGICYSPYLVFLYFAYLKTNAKDLIKEDLKRYTSPIGTGFVKLAYIFVYGERCFRNVIYYRLFHGYWGGKK